MRKESSITEVKGVGEKTAEDFAKLGVYTVGDILLRFPRDYFRYPKIEAFPLEQPLNEGMHAFYLQVKSGPKTRYYNGKTITTMPFGDENCVITATWFNARFIEKTILAGKRYVFYGKVSLRNGRWTMSQPCSMDPDQYAKLEGSFEPVYSLTEGITNNTIVRTLKRILSEEILFSDPIPSSIRMQEGFAEYNYALKQIHFPDSMEKLAEARNRLVFDEFFLFIMGMQYQKERQVKEKNAFSFSSFDLLEKWASMLPFPLTNAQKRTLQEIQADMESPYVMQRLIQGDVGSGKTIVAFLAMALCAVNGYQSAIMAPTEVLARQHKETFAQYCKTFGIDAEVVLLTGSMTAKEKRIAYEKLSTIPNLIVVGTHALIQEKSIFHNLALVVTDEQHRFGVRQRDTLSEKGMHPHILVMSATPIPRTLAIILYGDLDISVMDEVPAKRLPIQNFVGKVSHRNSTYDLIAKQVESGHQAYVICPLVEDTGNIDGENVEDYSKMLREHFHGAISVGMLHGKMKAEKKNKIMEDFASGKIQVLVSTTVVEVGVNVPNATVMMIENAERFGLAQLHQLRGRVGRGDAQSYCVMINASGSSKAQKRLELLNRSNDGFFLAKEDLKMRGPGDFFGIRQSGELAFQLGDIYQDADLMTKASSYVHEILLEDPELSAPEHEGLHLAMKDFMTEQLSKMNL